MEIFLVAKRKQRKSKKKEFLDFIKKGKIPQQKSIGQEEGKYIVPNILHKRIIQNLNEISTIRQIAQVMTVESSYIEFVKAGDNFTAKWIGDGEKEKKQKSKISKK